MNHNAERRIRLANEILALTVGAATLLLMVRMLGGKDGFKRVQMRGYRFIANSAKTGSDVLITIAANADTAYHKLTYTTL